MCTKKYEQVMDFNLNVMEASQKRMEYIFDNFENIIVSISGGKDSTVSCHLALKEANKRGRKIGIFFLDEEVVYDSTYKQIKYLMNLYPENTNKLWLQIPFNLTSAISYEESQLHCWEPGKHKIWMRHKEQDSITAKPWNPEKELLDTKKGLGFYKALENWESCYKDTAFIIGLRATESLNRWRTMIKNPGFKDCFWSTKRKSGNVNFYPVYDYHFSDVWRYISDNELKYSSLYDMQFKKGLPVSEMRTSSLIHEKSFKAIVDLPNFEPKTYNKLLKRIKGVAFAQETGKKNGGFKVTKLPKNFNTWIDYRDNLLASYPDENMKHVFTKRFGKHLVNNYVARQQCRQLILNDYENNLPVDNKEDPRDELIKKWREIL